MKTIFTSIWRFLISMEFMAFLILLFAVSIGAATFIENDFGTPASKAVVYNATWFELVLFFLMVNLISNIFRYQMYKVSKWPIFTFHLAFIVMIIGAGITRYISEEGILHIREGKASNAVVSDKTYFRFKVDDRKMQYSLDEQVYLNPLYNPGFSNSLEFNQVPISVKYRDFIENAMDTLVPDPHGANYLELVTTDGAGRKTVYLKQGEMVQMGFVTVGFDTDKDAVIRITTTQDGFQFLAPFEISYLKMADRSQGVLSADTIHPFESRRLYQFQGISMVYKGYHEKMKKSVTPVKQENAAQGADVLIVDLTVNGETEQVFLKGGKGMVPPPVQLQRAGLNFSLAYGSKYIYLPFFIQLRDFQLERYPGSNSPASFASEVTLIDEEQNINRETRIYMNHVLDHRGYRFFQSSYDTDEGGTVLSVNKDFWGTWISYIGYILLGIGMFFTLFIQDSRFSKMAKKLEKLRVKKAALPLLIGLVLNTFGGYAHNYKPIPVDQANKFGALLVQDQGGRMKPMNTLTSEILRKVSRKTTLNGMTSEQVFLGMMQDAHSFQEMPMIKISHNGVKEKIGLDPKEKLASFQQFFDEQYNYLLTDAVAEANQKKPAERSKFDNEILKVDERVNVCYYVYTGAMLRIFPLKDEPNNKWFTPDEAHMGFHGRDSLFVKGIFTLYFDFVNRGHESGDFEKAHSTLEAIKNFQKENGAPVYISENKLKAEIFYNKTQIFNNLFYFYFVVGLLFLVVLFIQLFNNAPVLKPIVNLFYGLVTLGFIAHIGGLILRWYISGHAPWSNAYESMVYIAFATMLSGFLFGQKSKITLAATTLLTSFILMVAHLNWLDPEVTNLVPVLNSYWLMIHVAIITASYGFLALGALLGLFNLILIITSPRGHEKIQITFKELTTINEMTITIGLFMLTIGTFLGGVWANESWGRYWGWDAKETWALASVLVYSFVAHMRFIPGLRGGFAYNFASLISFSAIIMTYFGVNYYLSGLHSYAAGDPVPIPSFVYYSLATVAIISFVAKKRFNTFQPSN